MRHLQIFLLLVTSAVTTHAQLPWDPRPKGEGMAGWTSYSHSWKIIQESGTMTGTVIKFNKEIRGCGDMISSAVAILKRPNDTVRVIMLCFDGELVTGQQVLIKVEKWQPGFGPGLPTDNDYFMEQRKKGLYVYRVNEFDETASKTVFGKREDQ